jgi:hypothetical protein
MDQDLTGFDRGPGDLLQPEHVLGCGAVPALHYRPHHHLAGVRWCRAGAHRCGHRLSPSQKLTL